MNNTPERPISPPEGKFPAKEHHALEIRDLAEEKIMFEIEKGQVPWELFDTLTTDVNDMIELTANVLLAAVNSKDYEIMKDLVRRYADKHSDKLREELDQEWVSECEERRNNPEGV